ncbi:MAG: serine hydroxymethyltransferase [bacterium]|nr:serine hydroxymethyltransferase [bacterium]
MLSDLFNYEKETFFNYINLIGSASYPHLPTIAYKSLPFQTVPHELTYSSSYFPRAETTRILTDKANILLHGLFEGSEEYDCDIQPWSGTQANQIVFNAVLKPGDRILALDLKSGGHISYHSFNKRFYNLDTYECGPDGLIDYTELCEKILAVKPQLVIIGGSSYPRSFKYEAVHQSCQEVGSLLLADIAHRDIYIAAKLHESPFGFADFITTTTHKALRGPRGGIILYKGKFARQLKNSVFPVMQGAPDIASMISKVSCLQFNTPDEVQRFALSARHSIARFKEFFESKRFPLISDGTDTHLLLVDIRCTGETGKELERLLEKNMILINRNCIPQDPLKANLASGIRLGSLGVASLGFNSEELNFVISQLEQVFQGHQADVRRIKSLIHEKVSQYLKGWENGMSEVKMRMIGQ